MDAAAPLLVLAAAVLVAAARRWLLHARRPPKRRLPPGSTGLPLIGETLRLVSAYRTADPEPFIDARVARHGGVFTTHVFGERTVFSADPAFNRLLLAAEGRAVDSSYPASIATLLGAHALLLTRGAAHKRLHSLTLARLGHTMRQWEPAATVRLLDEAKKITFNLTVKQLVGVDPGAWTEGLRREYVKLIDGFFSIPFPLAHLLPFTTYGQALKARKKVAGALREVIRKRKEEKVEDGGTNEEEDEEKREKDMVEELLEAEGGSFSEEEMVDFCISLLVAGYETTSVLMTLAVKFVTETPAALAQLKEEHDSMRDMKGKNQLLEWNDYKSMPFTQCVINETLRVANLISGVFRRANTDINLVVNKLQNAVGANLFTPFGGGPRLCPGHELARVVVSVFLHHLLTRFSWEEAEEDRLIFFPTTRTLKGYPINLRLRPDQA
ncbi:hypothetical protein ACP70R_019351 [Stipagrostis hirtigluma subsp. patula]